jgi:hypothetical protein
MIATRLWRVICLTAFCALSVPTHALASLNATIINGDVQLRESYPSFGASTLFRFRLVAGPIVTIIPKDSRVEISSKRIVAKTQEWFETTYATGAKRHKGWVYAGELGNRKYIRLDSGVEERLPVAADNGMIVRPEMLANAIRLFFSSSAHAEPPSDAKEPPPAETDPIRTLLVGLAYVAIFIGSVLATKRWVYPRSDMYAFLTGLCVLLILGFITVQEFGDVIGHFIAK